MNTLKYLIGFCMLTACGSPEKQRAGAGKLDYRVYFYPYKTLATPKVYIYEDTLMHLREYQEVRTLVRSPDTLLEVTSYDTSFVKMLYTRLKIGEKQVSIEEEILYIPMAGGQRTAVPRVYQRSAISWLQPGTPDSISFILLSRLSLPGLTLNMANNGNFRKLTHPVPGLAYKPEDLLLQTSTEMWDYGKTVNGKQQKRIGHTTYWAKGVGMVADHFSYTDKDEAPAHYSLTGTLSLQGFKDLAEQKLP